MFKLQIFVVIFTFCVIMLFSKYLLLDKQILPIEVVQVIAPMKYVTENDIKNTFDKIGINKMGFFDLNMRKIKSNLKLNPWIYNINISRIWPNKLRIKFNEDVPVAYLNNEYIITREDCKVIDAKNINRDVVSLPTLIGDEKKSKKLCDTLAKLKISVKPIDVGIKKLVMSQRNSWYLKLDNDLIVLLGKKDIVSKVDKFVRFYTKLKYTNLGKDENTSLAYIDMRYQNGLAVNTKMEEKLTEIMETA